MSRKVNELTNTQQQTNKHGTVLLEMLKFQFTVIHVFHNSADTGTGYSSPVAGSNRASVKIVTEAFYGRDSGDSLRGGYDIIVVIIFVIITVIIVIIIVNIIVIIRMIDIARLC